ncbi:YcnI family protein [Agromyces archimandritae]|uniref:YcnI family protein n=1 Tax=Agromyces archimandritae TaxID=2781962 RepID=A0A975FQY4_9MICO|nr:YcnI family protein [Agromyces archimandritae]QTX05596.1 YcnI family protein [Agromyces archimandritae]
MHISLRRTLPLGAAALGAGALLALGTPLAASAHVTVDPSSTAAGGYAVLDFSLGHGCEGSPTTTLTIDIPEGIESVTPQMNPNWTVEKVADGDAVRQVVYRAVTPLEDGFRDTVSVQVRLPEDAAGETLEFPVLQECTEGETNWNEPSGDGAEPASPAPVVHVTEAVADPHGGHGAAGAGSTDEATAGTSEAADETPVDVFARVAGIGGLVLGVVALVVALTSRRRGAAL